jgi:Ca2+-binding RTX toxin-like protein
MRLGARRRRATPLATGGVVLLVATALAAGVQGSAAAAATPTCFGEQATIVGGSGSNTIKGTSGNDVIVAGYGNDVVLGGGGDDLICGGWGADRLHGGDGRDWIAGEGGEQVKTDHGMRISNDVLYGDTGDDVLSPGFDGRYPSDTPDRISYSDFGYPVTASTVKHTVESSHGVDSFLGDRAEIVGSSYDDSFTGGPRRDIFQGGPGADTMTGAGGEDTLRDDYQSAPHHTADRLNGGADDQLFTYGGNDVLEGEDGNDLLADYGRDAGVMEGGAGNDVISDGINKNPDQVVDGGPGTDTVTLYVDMLKEGWPRLTVDLASGFGRFESSTKVRFDMSSTDILSVIGLPLTFIGDGADNTVKTDGSGHLDASGNGGNDTFFGRAGFDMYDGGPGTDKVNTLGGPDTCVSVEVVTGGKCPAP